jgi:hypothetical protein
MRLKLLNRTGFEATASKTAKGAKSACARSRRHDSCSGHLKEVTPAEI